MYKNKYKCKYTSSSPNISNESSNHKLNRIYKILSFKDYNLLLQKRLRNMWIKLLKMSSISKAFEPRLINGRWYGPLIKAR